MCCDEGEQLESELPDVELANNHFKICQKSDEVLSGV